MRVLLVEDDPTTSKSIELMLTHANLNVYATDLGEEGIDLAKLYDYDLILFDCPPQLGYLTMSALCASTGLFITVVPNMLDVASMSQFLQMSADLLDVVSNAGASMEFDFMRFLINRYEPNDGPQQQVLAFLRQLFDDEVMVAPMLKSTAISDAGLTHQTIYEVDRAQFHRNTYDRALDSLNLVNDEIESMIQKAWGR